jgi:competence protein ComEA
MSARVNTATTRRSIMFRKFFAVLLTAVAFNAFAAVDANRATQAELETVKGIGPGLSAKIVKARETGQFKSWADFVERVGGVGPGNAARFSQAGLTVSGGALDPAALPAPTKGSRKAADGASTKAMPTDKGDKGDKTEKRTKKSADPKAPQA